MAYPVRLFVSGYWYHVYTRGQRREPLFFSPSDRRKYLSLLEDEIGRRGGQLGSYCLMTNHLHLLIKMEETNLGKIFQAVHSKYARFFNSKRETVGHVFQGRPGVKIVLDESYLRTLVGYIHRNPVEAGVVDSVEDYEWSSWSRFAKGRDERVDADVWTFPPGFREGNRRERFRGVLKDSMELPEGKNYWGTKQEWESMERRREGREGRKFEDRRDRRSLTEILMEVLEETDYSAEELKGSSQAHELTAVRREAMVRLYQEGHGPTAIGKFFNRTPGSVTHACEVWSSD